MTLRQLAEKYSERLRMCKPTDRPTEAQQIAKEIKSLKTDNGLPLTKSEEKELLDFVEYDAIGKPQRIVKAHDATSFNDAVRIIRDQLAKK